MLKINKLNKTYSSHIQALKGISLEVPAGIFGLLGPNGAGKTTLMKILATLLEADSGTAEMNGVDLIRDKDQAYNAWLLAAGVWVLPLAYCGANA
jgi:ABC-type multidrug transport system ATPase subunit